MRARRRKPLRGLLTGVLALVVFATSAVTMTAGGSIPGASIFTQEASGETVADREQRASRGARSHDRDARHRELSGERGRDHR